MDSNGPSSVEDLLHQIEIRALAGAAAVETPALLAWIARAARNARCSINVALHDTGRVWGGTTTCNRCGSVAYSGTCQLPVFGGADGKEGT